jgi:hypothetical protein
MRLRVSIILVAFLAAFFAPAPDKALGFGGYASAPLSLTATAIAGGVRVGWSSPTDVDTGVTGYRVEYSTSGTSGTWTTSATVSSSTFSYDIVGVSQVETYVRVAATTAAGTGTYGYPWTKLYGTTAQNRDANGIVSFESGFGVGASDPYTTLNGSSFSRVRYRMEATISGTAYYAEADAYKWPSGTNTNSRGGWDPTIRSLVIPSKNSPYQYSIQANVADLNVYSNNSAVLKGSGRDGRLEIWPWNYGTTTNGLSPSGSSSTYDYDDVWDSGGYYGSFQVYDMSNLQPVFVWNNSTSGATAEIAFGKNSGTHPDWTFCSGGGASGSCPSPSAFKLQIFANIPITPLADSTAPTVVRVDSKLVAKNSDTITVRSTEAGTVYLVNSSVSVSSVASITSASASNKNSVSIVAATNTTITISSLADGTYNLYAADAFNNLSAAVAGTIRIDNTAPTAISIAVNTSGTAILLTASETITNSAQVTGIYTLSDGGASLSVASTSYSGLVATLNLNRAVPAGATVTFAYSPSSGAASGRWIDVAGNELAAISSRTITNNSASTISMTLTAPSTVYKGVVVDLSLSVGAAGKVTFTVGGKRIAGCISKSATGSLPISVICSWKPTVQGNQILGATLYPSTAGYATTSASSINRYVLKRSNTR